MTRSEKLPPSPPPRGAWGASSARVVLRVAFGLALMPACTSVDPQSDDGRNGGGAAVAGGAGASIGGAAPNGGNSSSGGSSRGGTTGGGGSSAGAGSGNGGSASGGMAGTAGRGGSAPGGSAGEGGGSTGGTAGRGGSSTGGSDGRGGGASGGLAGQAGGGGAGGAKFVGNITTRNSVRSDFVNYWDQITPENEGKWSSCEPSRDSMNWAGMDRVRDYARQHGIPYKGHTLVWGSQYPSWITGLSQSDQRAEVEEWVRLFCERYGDVAIIDVVNEPPPHTTPPFMNALGGAGSSGYDWIAQSFRWAKQYCPNALLLFNDYNNIEYGADVERTIEMVNAIQAAGAPIDGVGAQAHDAYKLPVATLRANIDRIAAETGLPIYITEYDIDLANDTEQRNVMESQFSMFYTHPAVRGITLWGYVSGSTWRPNTGLMSSSGTPRPALTWLMDYLGR